MGRPARYDREQIIDATLAIARREGLREVTARRIAKELGASTSVIYGRFDSVDAIRDAAIGRVLGTGTARLVQEMQTHGLKVIVVALCTLGQREPWLFQSVDLGERSHPGWAASRLALAQVMGTMEDYAHLELDERLAIVSRVTVVAVGMAISAAVGDLTDLDSAYRSLVEPVIEHARRTRPRDDLLAGG